MYYATELFVRKGKLGHVWMAGTMFARLNKRIIVRANVAQMCDDVAKPPVQLALRTSATLFIGIVRIENKQVAYLESDALRARADVLLLGRPGGPKVDLGAANLQAAPEAITHSATDLVLFQDNDMILANVDRLLQDLEPRAMEHRLQQLRGSIGTLSQMQRDAVAAAIADGAEGKNKGKEAHRESLVQDIDLVPLVPDFDELDLLGGGGGGGGGGGDGTGLFDMLPPDAEGNAQDLGHILNLGLDPVDEKAAAAANGFPSPVLYSSELSPSIAGAQRGAQSPSGTATLSPGSTAASVAAAAATRQRGKRATRPEQLENVELSDDAIQLQLRDPSALLVDRPDKRARLAALSAAVASDPLGAADLLQRLGAPELRDFATESLGDWLATASGARSALHTPVRRGARNVDGDRGGDGAAVSETGAGDGGWDMMGPELSPVQAGRGGSDAGSARSSLVTSRFLGVQLRKDSISTPLPFEEVPGSDDAIKITTQDLDSQLPASQFPLPIVEDRSEAGGSIRVSELGGSPAARHDPASAAPPDDGAGQDAEMTRILRHVIRNAFQHSGDADVPLSQILAHGEHDRLEAARVFSHLLVLCSFDAVRVHQRAPWDELWLSRGDQLDESLSQ